MARALSRLVVGRGGPRDLAAVRDGIAAAEALAARLKPFEAKSAEMSAVNVALLAPEPALKDTIDAALAAELPLFKRDGGFVREGVCRRSTRRAACATTRGR